MHLLLHFYITCQSSGPSWLRCEGLAIFAAKLSVSSRTFSNPSIQITQVRFLTQLFQYNCNSSPDYSHTFLVFVTNFLVISVVCKLNFAQIPIAMAQGNEYTI